PLAVDRVESRIVDQLGLDERARIETADLAERPAGETPSFSVFELEREDVARRARGIQRHREPAAVRAELEAADHADGDAVDRLVLERRRIHQIQPRDAVLVDDERGAAAVAAQLELLDVPRDVVGDDAALSAREVLISEPRELRAVIGREKEA